MDEGVSYGDYVEQLTYLLFLKMAEEKASSPFAKISVFTIPEGYDWKSLISKDGDELEIHYRHILEALAREEGMLGVNPGMPEACAVRVPGGIRR